MTTPRFLDDPTPSASSLPRGVDDAVRWRAAVLARSDDRSRSDAPPGGRPPDRARRSRPYRWRVLVWRSRFLVAALLLGSAAALAAAQMRPASPAQVAVVVAARPLHPGAALTAADLRVLHVPAGTAPDGAHTEPDAVLGRAPVVAVATGLTIVDALLADDRLAGSGPPGTVVVPVRLADPGVAAILRPGDLVDLFASATSSTGEPVAQRLAERAVVLPHPPSEQDPGTASSGLLGAAPTDDGAGTLTLVAVAPGQAAALAGVTGWAGISAVLVE